MSLEWARARLLQHAEELRKLCEAQATARARQLARELRHKRPRAQVLTLRPGAPRQAAGEVQGPGKVLQFAQPGGRRRA